jgi:hypothetical protein
VETVKKATEEDTKGNLEAALPLYRTSLEYFLTALKCNSQGPESGREGVFFFKCNAPFLEFIEMIKWNVNELTYFVHGLYS